MKKPDLILSGLFLAAAISGLMFAICYRILQQMGFILP